MSDANNMKKQCIQVDTRLTMCVTYFTRIGYIPVHRKALIINFADIIVRI